MVPNMPVPMVIIHMVVISMSSLANNEKNNLGNMHNKNILGDNYTYLLFCLFLQCCEALKQLARTAFVQNVHFSNILKRDKLMPRKDPFLVFSYRPDLMTELQPFIGIFYLNYFCQ